MHLSIKEFLRDSIIEGIHLCCKFASMSCSSPTSNIPLLYWYVNPRDLNLKSIMLHIVL